MTAFWILKKAKAMPKITVQITSTPMACATELAEAQTRVAVEDAGDAASESATRCRLVAFQPAP